MTVTTTEFKENTDKYLLLSATEDIYITKNGKVISLLCAPFRDRAAIAQSLFGSVPAEITPEDAKAELLGKI